jgi:hypothetical protein
VYQPAGEAEFSLQPETSRLYGHMAPITGLVLSPEYRQAVLFSSELFLCRCTVPVPVFIRRSRFLKVYIGIKI